MADTRRDEADNDQTSGLSQWLHTETTAAPANNRRKPPKAIQKLHRQMKKPVYNDGSTEGTEMANFAENDASTRSDSSNCDCDCCIFASVHKSSSPVYMAAPELKTYGLH